MGLGADGGGGGASARGNKKGPTRKRGGFLVGLVEDGLFGFAGDNFDLMTLRGRGDHAVGFLNGSV